MEEQTFMIQQDEAQKVIKSTQVAKQQNMLRLEEKSAVIGKPKRGSKKIF